MDMVSIAQGEERMFTPEGFRLFSFVVGCKHTRTFALNSVSGIIADYVLGTV